MKYLFIFLLIFACASKEAKKPVEYKDKAPQITTTKPKPGPDPTSRMLASELGTDLVAEITFEKGSTVLSEKNKTKLKNFISEARKKGSLTEAQVVTWADKEYPSKEAEELSSDQKELAEKRNKSLEKYFKRSLKDIEFTAVSMAERPSYWGRLTASENTNIKKSLQLSEIATTASENQEVTNASKSIIMLFYSE